MSEWNNDALSITNGGKGDLTWTNIAIIYPPYGTPVLVTDGKSYQIRTLILKDNLKYWSTDHSHAMNYSVSHWMPLPELPKD